MDISERYINRYIKCKTPRSICEDIRNSLKTQLVFPQEKHQFAIDLVIVIARFALITNYLCVLSETVTFLQTYLRRQIF